MTRPPITVPADVDELDVWTWNAHLSCPPKRLRTTLTNEALRDGRPHLILLNEVPYLYDTLAEWAEVHGYAHLQERMGNRRARVVEEHGSTAVLVDQRRAGLAVLSRRVAKMGAPWMVFSKRRLHRGRRYETLRLVTPGGLWRIRASHWPTKGNAHALAESMTRAAAWFARRRPGTVAADIGDHNLPLAVLRAWARAFGARVFGFGVDSAVVAGADCEATELGKFGSDHHAIRYRLTRRTKRRRTTNRTAEESR